MISRCWEHKEEHTAESNFVLLRMITCWISIVQVRTVQMGRYAEYDRTNKFSLTLGFRKFEVFPTSWDESNPYQIYTMNLK